MPVRLSVRAVLGEVFGCYRSHAAPLLTMAAICFIPAVLVAELLAQSSQTAGAGLLIGLSGPATFLYAGAIAPIATDRERPAAEWTPSSLWSEAAPSIRALILGGIVFTLGTTAGAMLFVIPGLVLFTIWALAPAAVRLEGCGPLAALGRSWELVRTSPWLIAAIVIGTSILAFLISTAMPLAAIGIAGESTGSYVGSWLGVVLAVPPIGLMPTILYGHLTAYDPGTHSGSPGDLEAGSGAGADEEAYEHEEESESA